jgi:hypothetical protein
MQQRVLLVVLALLALSSVQARLLEDGEQLLSQLMPNSPAPAPLSEHSTTVIPMDQCEQPNGADAGKPVVQTMKQRGKRSWTSPTAAGA